MSWRSKKEHKPLIATIEEKTEFTGGGAFCVILLVLAAVGTAMSITAAKNAIQEIDAAVMGMSSIMLFGVGAIIGRRRTYSVYRELPPS